MMDLDLNPGFRSEHPKEPKRAGHLGKCSLLKLRKVKEAYRKHKARYKSITKRSLEDDRKRKVDESMVPPSFPLPPIPDFVEARSRTKANTKLQNTQASKECALCWPLGASEIGVCICSDLALCNVQTASSSVVSRHPRGLLGALLSQSQDANDSASSSVAREPSFPSPSVAQPTGDSNVTSNAVTSRRPSQEASTCPRCWPLGAASLGYCICDDLAIAGILPQFRAGGNSGEGARL